MSTHRYNRIKYYQIITNAAFSTFNDGDHQKQLVSKIMLAMLDKIMYMCKRTYKKLYRI